MNRRLASAAFGLGMLLTALFAGIASAAVATSGSMRVLAAPKSFSFPAGSADTTPLAAGDVASTIAHLHGLGAAFNFPASAAGALPAVSLFDRPNLSITAVLNAARPVVVDALASQVPAEAAFELPRDTVLNSLFTAPASSKSVFAAARDAAIDGHTFVLTSSPGSLMSSVPVASSVHGLLLDSASATVSLSTGARDAGFSGRLVAAINDALTGAGGLPLLEQEILAAKALVRFVLESGIQADKLADSVLLVFDGLRDVAHEASDRSGDLGRQAAATLGAAIQDLVATSAAGDSTLFTMMSLPFRNMPLSLRVRSEETIPRHVAPYTCFDTEATCLASTNNCSGLAGCHIHKKDATRECWRCNCGPSHSGDSCEFVDVTVSFALVATVVGITVVALVAIIVTMLGMDSGDDSIIHRTASHAKHA